MRGLAHDAVADADFLCPLDGERGSLHARHRPEAVAGVDHEGRGPVVHEPRRGFGVDFAALDDADIARQPRDAVAVDAAQVGPHQAIRDHRGFVRLRTQRHQHVANEAVQFFLGDKHAFAHSISPITTALSFPAKAGNPVTTDVLRINVLPIDQ